MLFFLFFVFMAVVLYAMEGYSVYQSWLAFVAHNFADWFGGNSHHPKLVATKLFLSFSAIVALILGGYFISVMTSFIVDGQLRDYLKIRNMDKHIGNLEGHIVICGADDTTREAVEELTRINAPFVVIYPHREKIEAMGDHFLYLDDDPTKDETLIEAGIMKAKGILASLDSDPENLYLTITVHSINPSLKIIAKVFDDDACENKLKKAGATEVISPFNIGGLRMASLLTRPTVVTFLDKMMHQSGTKRFEEVVVQENSSLVGKTLATSDVRKKTGIVPIALQRDNEKEFQYNLSPHTTIMGNDTLIVIGEPDQVAHIRKLAS